MDGIIHMREIVVAITGASGVIYGVRLLQALRDAGQSTALILSGYAAQLLETETDYTPQQVQAWANAVYDENDFSAPIASGSHPFHGMAVCPCSMKTLSAMANGYADNLISRAAENCLKMNWPLVVVPRDTPLSLPSIENMRKLKEAGAIILPPNLSFYNNPKTIDDAVSFIVGKTMDCFGLSHRLYKKWGEKNEA